MGATQALIEANLLALTDGDGNQLFENQSNLAMLQIISNSIGIPIDNTIQEFTNNQNLILSTITTKNYGKAAYYTSAALAFQYGYNLSVDPTTGDFFYAVIDSTAQIIAQAAFEEITSGNGSDLFLKLASLNTITGLLQAPTPLQQAAFANYFINYQLPGVPVSLVFGSGDVINFSFLCTYFSTYDLSLLQTAIQSALTAFVQSFKFNGEFFNGDLSDYMKQNVPGVRDFFLFNTTINGAAFQGFQTLDSGYFNYDLSIPGKVTNNANYTAVNA
jgi:hypothetical protein